MSKNKFRLEPCLKLCLANLARIALQAVLDGVIPIRVTVLCQDLKVLGLACLSVFCRLWLHEPCKNGWTDLNTLGDRLEWTRRNHVLGGGTYGRQMANIIDRSVLGCYH